MNDSKFNKIMGRTRHARDSNWLERKDQIMRRHSFINIIIYYTTYKYSVYDLVNVLYYNVLTSFTMGATYGAFSAYFSEAQVTLVIALNVISVV